MHYTLSLKRGDSFINNKIREMRRLKNITQDELAAAVSVTRQTIISLENGKYNASLALAHKLAVFFKVSIEELFLFEED